MKPSCWTLAISWAIFNVFVAGNSQAQVYDLADGWSDVNNPNGAWTLYKAFGVPFNTVQADWYGAGTNPTQPAWADAPGPNAFPPNPLVPMWAKAVGDMGTLTGDPAYNGFVNAGTVFMASAESFRTGTGHSSVVWHAPHAGTIHIDGGVWMAQAFQDRPHYWELRKNGVVFTGGPLSFGDGHDKSNPFLFSEGTGSAEAIDLAVTTNEQIELLIYKTGDFLTPGTFVAVDISLELVPEPGTLALIGGLVCVGIVPRRKRMDPPSSCRTIGSAD